MGRIKEELAHRLRVGGLAAACGLLFTGAIYQETFECEEAIDHLHDCCPNLYAVNACGDGCSGVSLQGGESQCILERDCDELEDLEVCHRVEELSEGAFGTDNDQRDWVCP